MIQRWEAKLDSCGCFNALAENGDFVRFADHQQEVERLRAINAEMYEALKAIDDSWAREGWTPENAKARTCFTDDTIERWKRIRAALAKAEGKS
jgi:hypothetical protein